MNQPEFLVLVDGDEPVERVRLGNLGQGCEPRRCGFRGSEIRRDDLDRVGPRLRVLSQLEERRNRFDLWVSQMQWIEIERQEQEQRRGEHYHEDCRHHDRHPMPLQKPVHRGERGEPHRVRLAPRMQHHQQCRQQRDRSEKRNDHAAAGDLPELGQAPVFGRHESGESECCGRRGKGQRHSGFSGGTSEPGAQIPEIVPFGAVTHAELEPEIDAEADEQDEERH